MSRLRLGSALWIPSLLLLWAVASSAWARSPRGRAVPSQPPEPPSPSVRAAQLVGEGVLALASRDFAAASRALAAAYRLQPSADTLYQLGIVAWSEGQSLTAQDLLRRYLAEPGAQPSPEKVSEAQRIVAQALPDCGEVWVLGAAGDWVFVDDRLLGQLPLPLPLLLSPGAHRLSLEATPGARRTAELKLTSGQLVAVRASDAGLTTSPLVRVVLHVAARSADAGSPDPRPRRLAALLLAQDLAVPTAASHQSPPSGCDLACLLRLAKEQAAEWALAIQLPESVDGKHRPGQVQVIDVAVQDVAAQAGFAPAPASADADEAELSALLPGLLQKARGRGHGELRVSSSPVGAEVRIGARVLGTTPLRRTHFIGPVELELSLPGFVPARRQVEIRSEHAAELSVTLSAPPQALVVPPQPSRRPRPAWRIGLGIGALAAGIGLVALGASALSVSGRCIDAVEPPVAACPRFFDTSAIGGVLIGSGAALGVAGALLVAWPGAKPSPAVGKGE